MEKKKSPDTPILQVIFLRLYMAFARSIVRISVSRWIGSIICSLVALTLRTLDTEPSEYGLQGSLMTLGWVVIGFGGASAQAEIKIVGKPHKPERRQWGLLHYC